MRVETVERLQEKNSTRQREWDTNDDIDLAYRGNELAGEVGEACNVIKKLARERLGIRGSRATVEQLAEELADVIICSSLIANSEGIDLAEEYGLDGPVKFNNRDVGLALRGNRLTVATARVCSVILEAPFKSFSRAKLGVYLSNLCCFVGVIAAAEDIDMDQAVVAKFNATSVKVGLKTRM